MDDTQRLVTTGNTPKEVFHATRDCSQVRTDLRPRSADYAEWHDLRPCQYCHGQDDGVAADHCDRCGAGDELALLDGRWLCPDCQDHVARADARRVVR